MKKYIIAIDAGGTFFKSAIVSSDAEIVKDSICSVPANSDLSAEDVREGYYKTLKTQLENASKVGIKISAVAVDTPGPFDYENGISKMQHKFKAIYGMRIRPWITDVVGELPITFIHDSAAFLQGEMWHSPYGEYKNAAGVMIGTGLGFATMKDNVVLRKSDGSPLYSVWGEKYRDGIAEDYVSGRGISLRYKSKTATAKEIEFLAKNGDDEARKVYVETGKILAEVIKPYLKIVNAEILILGGQISRGFELFQGELAECLSDVETLKVITRSRRLDTSHMLGAAYDCFQKIGFENMNNM